MSEGVDRLQEIRARLAPRPDGGEELFRASEVRELVEQLEHAEALCAQLRYVGKVVIRLVEASDAYAAQVKREGAPDGKAYHQLHNAQEEIRGLVPMLKEGDFEVIAQRHLARMREASGKVG